MNGRPRLGYEQKALSGRHGSFETETEKWVVAFTCVEYLYCVPGECAMTSERPIKKNASIEVRLSDEAKSAFMDRCREQGQTASEAIRLFIDKQAETPTKASRHRLRYGRIILAGLIGAGLGIGVAAPSIARSTTDSRFVFEDLDRNHDGVIDHGEFDAR